MEWGFTNVLRNSSTHSGSVESYNLSAWQTSEKTDETLVQNIETVFID